MTRTIPIATLRLDIGGVLLANGWDHHAREQAATHFKLGWAEMNSRYHMTLDGIRGVLHVDYQSTR